MKKLLLVLFGLMFVFSLNAITDTKVLDVIGYVDEVLYIEIEDTIVPFDLVGSPGQTGNESIGTLHVYANLPYEITVTSGNNFEMVHSGGDFVSYDFLVDGAVSNGNNIPENALMEYALSVQWGLINVNQYSPGNYEDTITFIATAL